MIIYTIGYEKRNIQEYIKLLKTAKVQTLIDVRETPWSYKSDFCKTKLSKELSYVGIDYIHVKELGNPKRFRDGQSSPDIVLKRYKAYLKETQSGMATLLNFIWLSNQKEENICLTCFEKDHKTCHRSIITGQISCSLVGKIVHL